MAHFRDTHFALQKSTKPQSQQLHGNLHGIVWNSGHLDYSEIPNILTSDVKGEFFAKRIENCKILGSLMDKNVKNMDDHSCSKFQEPVETDKRKWICPSYPFRHKTTLHRAERKTKLFSGWTKQHLKF